MPSAYTIGVDKPTKISRYMLCKHVLTSNIRWNTMEKWKEDLQNTIGKALEEQEERERIHNQRMEEIKEFSTSKVIPAFEELKTELESGKFEKYRLKVQLYTDDILEQSIKVEDRNSKKELIYTIRAQIPPDGIQIYSVTAFGDIGDVKPQEKRGQIFNISKVTQEDIAQDFVDNIKQYYVKDIVK